MEQPTTIDVFPRGDVVLVCGDNDDAKRRIRVSSAFLSQASPVFKAMFGPHFREGHALATDSNIEIPLPDDSPRAMELMCLVIHLRNDKVPRIVDAVLYLEIPRLCDKYDTVVAMRPTVQLWLYRCVEDNPGCWLAADLTESAFLFKVWKSVADLGVVLVKTASTDVRSLHEKEAEATKIPFRISSQLEDHRLRQLRLMHKAVEEEIITLLDAPYVEGSELCEERCGGMGALTQHLLRSLLCGRIWPFIFYQLERHRREQQRRMLQAFEDQISELTDSRNNTCCEQTCKAVNALTSHLVGELADAGFWPSSMIQTRSLDATADCVSSIGVDDLEGAVKCSKHCPHPTMKTSSHAFECIRYEIDPAKAPVERQVRPKKKRRCDGGFRVNFIANHRPIPTGEGFGAVRSVEAYGGKLGMNHY